MSEPLVLDCVESKKSCSFSKAPESPSDVENVNEDCSATPSRELRTNGADIFDCDWSHCVVPWARYPAPNATTAGVSARLKRTFRELADTWKAECGTTSLVAELAMHPAYQQIIGLGPQVVPLILAELDKEPDHWFWALAAITRANPVPDHSRGRIAKMADAWLRWGKQKGYRW